MKHHLQDRRIERSLVPLCEQHGTAAGRVLAEVAASLDATPLQVALAFLLHACRGFVIPKAAVGVARVVLDASALVRLNAAFRPPC